MAAPYNRITIPLYDNKESVYVYDYILLTALNICGRGTVFGTAIRYGLKDSGFEIQFRR